MHKVFLCCLSLAALHCSGQHGWRHRVVVVAANAFDAAREPIADATARIECPEGISAPEIRETSTNEYGQAVMGTLGPGVSSECTVVVEAAGYVSQRFLVADTCLEPPETLDPFVCTAGVAFAPLVLDGPWNDADAGSAASALANECFTKPTWAGDGQPPSIRLHRVINKTDEHIDIKAVGDRILRVAVDSPRLRVLETGRVGDPVPPSDFYLVLEMTSILEQHEEMRTKTYRLTAQVIRTTDTELVCQSTHVRTKQSIRAKTTW